MAMAMAIGHQKCVSDREVWREKRGLGQPRLHVTSMNAATMFYPRPKPPLLRHSPTRPSPHPCMVPRYPGYGPPPYRHFQNVPFSEYNHAYNHAYNHNLACSHAATHSLTGSQAVSYPHRSMLPPDAHKSRKSWRLSSDEDAPELSKCGVGDEALASALAFVSKHSQGHSQATLFDIRGIIADVARADEGASRFVQKRIKKGSAREKCLGLTAALSNFDELACDKYGNFMLQALLQFGSVCTRGKLMEAIYSRGLDSLSLHAYGCNVIQKAISCLGQKDFGKLLTEIHGKLFTFISDQNGTHVIQRIIQVISYSANKAAENGDPDLSSRLSDQIQFIIDYVVTHAETLSTHKYGGRVVQRALKVCVDHQKTALLESVMSCHKRLVTDPHGNYVVQKVLTCGNEAHRAAVLETLTEKGGLLSMSVHKYASSVVMSLLLHGESHHKEKLLGEMLQDSIIDVMGESCGIEVSSDPVANYVVRKAMEASESDQEERIIKVIRYFVNARNCLDLYTQKMAFSG